MSNGHVLGGRTAAAGQKSNDLFITDGADERSFSCVRWVRDAPKRKGPPQKRHRVIETAEEAKVAPNTRCRLVQTMSQLSSRTHEVMGR